MSDDFRKLYQQQPVFIGLDLASGPDYSVKWDAKTGRWVEIKRSPLADKVDRAIAAGRSPWDKT